MRVLVSCHWPTHAVGRILALNPSKRTRQSGNSAIAAHRDGRFRALRKIKAGDDVRMRTSRGELRYKVRELSIVEPDDLSVLASHGKSSLTLITCYPFTYFGNAPKRFVVRAERVASAARSN